MLSSLRCIIQAPQLNKFAVCQLLLEVTVGVLGTQLGDARKLGRLCLSSVLIPVLLA